MTTSEQQYTVLVVDDSTAIRAIMKSEFEKRGYRVFTAEDGVQGVDVFKREKPDVVTLDVNMPNMDGFQACAAIRSSVGGLEVPIVFITGNDTLEDRERGFALGAMDFVSKYSERAWKDAADVVDKVLVKDKKLEGILALVVSTRDISLRIMTSSFSRFGVEVIQAGTDESVITTIQEKKDELDMILVDFTTIGLDCFQICDVVRNQLHLHDLPVLFLVSQEHQPMILDMYKAGITDQIKKPFTQEELRGKIISYLEARSLVKKLGREIIKNKMILEVAGEGIMGIGPDGRINFVNPAAADMIGMHIGDFVSRYFAEFVAVEQTGTDQITIPHFQERNEGRSALKKISGEMFPIHFSAAPVIHGQENLGGVIVFNDITISLQHEKERQATIKMLEQEMHAAGSLQRSLLPKKRDVEAISGLDIGFFCKAYSPVSGDFLIVEELAENKVAVLVIDVMGHGVKAGLATIRMKTLFDDCKRSYIDPAQLITDMNNNAFTLIDNGLFQTVLLAVFDLDQDKVVIGSAGGIPPLFYSAATGETVIYETSGNPVGITSGDDFEVDILELDFKSGDGFILQTDGTLECVNAEGTAFDGYLTQNRGKAHLGTGKDSQTIVDDLISDAHEFVGEHGFDDDITLIVIQKK
jgi:PAS domain S-box-containing protein